MLAEVDLHPEIEEFIHVDAEGVTKNRFLTLLTSLPVAAATSDRFPNTTAALTPLLSRHVKNCRYWSSIAASLLEVPVSFIQPIGGYAFGQAGAQYIIDNCEGDCNVLALLFCRVLMYLKNVGQPQNRFEGADNINVVGVEFGDGDNAKVKSIVTDYLDRFGTLMLSGWMQARPLWPHWKHLKTPVQIIR